MNANFLTRAAFAACAVFGAVAAPASAEAGDVLIRLRGLIVGPTERSSGLMPAFPTAHVSLSDSYIPEIDFSYFITKHIAAELVLASSHHDVYGRGPLAPLGRIAEVRTLPPVLTLQYHFLPDNNFVRPYAGVGINNTLFFNQRPSPSLVRALGPTTVSLKDSAGYSFQLGADIPITKHFFANFDVKYVSIDTTAKLTSGSGPSAAVNRVHISIDPIVAGAGVGVRF